MHLQLGLQIFISSCLFTIPMWIPKEHLKLMHPKVNSWFCLLSLVPHSLPHFSKYYRCFSSTQAKFSFSHNQSNSKSISRINYLSPHPLPWFKPSFLSSTIPQVSLFLCSFSIFCPAVRGIFHNPSQIIYFLCCKSLNGFLNAEAFSMAYQSLNDPGTL